MAHSSAIWIRVTRSTSGHSSAQSFLKIAPIMRAARSSGGACGTDHGNEDRAQRTVVHSARLGTGAARVARAREYFACMLAKLRQGALEQEPPFVEKGYVCG